MEKMKTAYTPSRFRYPDHRAKRQPKSVGRFVTRQPEIALPVEDNHPIKAIMEAVKRLRTKGPQVPISITVQFNKVAISEKLLSVGFTQEEVDGIFERMAE